MSSIWRLNVALAESGKTRSPWYKDISLGVMTRPVKIGIRAVGWPADEVRAINAARISGKSIEQIRKLVDQLHDARKAVR